MRNLHVMLVVATLINGCAGLLGADDYRFAATDEKGPASDSGPAVEPDSSSSSFVAPIENDAATPDALATPDATPDGTMDAPPDAPSSGVILRASFDSDCNGWSGNEAQLTFGPMQGVSGGGACMICRNGSDPEFTMEYVLDAPRPGTYAMSFFARRSEGSSPTRWISRVEVHTGGQQRDVEQSGTLDNSYQKLNSAVANVETSDFLLFALGSPSASVGVCMLIDEVVITYSPP